MRVGFDVAIIGGGSAGFAAAIRAHELGKTVALINDGAIGGTCVNVGCVPSKTLIRAAESVFRGRHTAFAGVSLKDATVDWKAIRDQKDALVAELRQQKYTDVLKAYPRIELVRSPARFLDAERLDVGGRLVEAPRSIITTGSHPWIPDIPGLAEASYLTSTTAFDLEALPSSLIVVGGRYIGLECAQMFARLGVRVTLLQRSHRILPEEAPELTNRLTSHLSEEGIEVMTDVDLASVTRREGEVWVEATVGGEPTHFRADAILCATGRRPSTADMGLEALGVELGLDGSLLVDAQLRTSIPNIFGAGDVIGDPSFVYTAAYEGQLAAENAVGDLPSPRDYSALPWVIFTDPQVAGVGFNAAQGKAQGLDVETAHLELEHVPRALAARDTRGFVELYREKGKDKLIGARILAPEGGEQIMEAALALRYGIPISDLARAFHPYLTQSEAIKLCAQTFGKDVSKLSCCAA